MPRGALPWPLALILKPQFYIVGPEARFQPGQFSAGLWRR